NKLVPPRAAAHGDVRQVLIVGGGCALLLIFAREDDGDQSLPGERTRALEKCASLFFGQGFKKRERQQHIVRLCKLHRVGAGLPKVGSGQFLGVVQGPSAVVEPTAFFSALAQCPDQKTFGAAGIEKRGRFGQYVGQKRGSLAE